MIIHRFRLVCGIVFDSTGSDATDKKMRFDHEKKTVNGIECLVKA